MATATTAEQRLATAALVTIAGEGVPVASQVAIAATEEFVKFKAVTGAVSAATGVVEFSLPFAGVLLDCGFNVKTANAQITAVDVNKNGVSCLTTVLTTDATETSTATASIPKVLAATALITFAAGDELQFDVDSINAGSATDLYCWAKFRRTS